MGDQAKLTGGCYCESFRYEISKPVKWLYNCHCTNCCKTHGGVFLPMVCVPSSDVTILADTASKVYKTSEFVNRYFCTTCGCSTYHQDARTPGYLMISGGTFDVYPNIPCTGEIYDGSKAPWHQLYDGVPRCPGLELFLDLPKLS